MTDPYHPNSNVLCFLDSVFIYCLSALAFYVKGPYGVPPYAIGNIHGLSCIYTGF